MIMAANHPPDMIILDLGLPDENGHKVLKKLREWYTNPIIILSVQNNEEDIIKAFDNGANDYLVKPFRTGELLARIRSALRSRINENNEPVIINLTTYEIDLAIKGCKKKQIIKLTATEYNLLALFEKMKEKFLHINIC